MIDKYQRDVECYRNFPEPIIITERDGNYGTVTFYQRLKDVGFSENFAHVLKG